MTENLPHRSCPTCAGMERRMLFAQRFESLANVSLTRGYDVVACARCGLVYADRIPSAEAFALYYADASKYEYSHSGGEQHWAERQRLARLAERIAALAPVSARLLDVGCSTGELLVALRAQGFSNLTGLDPSQVCVRYAQANGFQMIHQLLGARPAHIAQFEVIVLSAVLEHVPDLHGFLDFVEQWLTPDGFLVVEVPDAGNFARAFNAPYQEFSVEHINFFSAPALDNLLGVHGYARIAKYQDLCNAGGNLTGAGLTAMYRGGAGETALVRESTSEDGVQAYLAKCLEAIETERDVIAEFVESQMAILVWGVGTLCQRLLASTPLRSANIVAFVDSNPHYQGSTLVGRPVLAPSELSGHTEPILVLSWGFFEEIRSQIRDSLALRNDIVRIDRASMAGLR
jgi:SAM-dependent methyltransferase